MADERKSRDTPRSYAVVYAKRSIPSCIPAIHAPSDFLRTSDSGKRKGEALAKGQIVRFKNDSCYMAHRIFSRFASNMVLERVKHLELETSTRRPVARLQLDDDRLTANLWRVVERYVPDTLHFISSSPYFSKRGGSEWHKFGLVPMIDAVKQETGRLKCPLMTDRFFKRFLIRDDERFQQQSFLVVTLQLSEEGIDFEGGHTSVFLNADLAGDCPLKMASASDEKSADCGLKEAKPTRLVSHATKGTALCSVYENPYLFAPVTKGVKYLVRMHVLYERQIIVDNSTKDRMRHLGLWKPQVGDWQILAPQ